MLHAAFVRSPHAHALIRSIDTAVASRMSGVAAIYTAKDLENAGVRLRMPLGFPSTTLPGNITPFVLTPSEVCFVGEAVAMVVADSRYIAEDAVTALEIEYEPLGAVADLEGALAAGAPKVRKEAPSNVLTRFRVAYGDAAGGFAGAPHVFRERLAQHRGAA